MTDTITLPRTEAQKVIHALEINRVMAQDKQGNYTRDVTPKSIISALTIMQTALEKQVEPAQPECRTLYECRGCGHLYAEKTSSCDCLENGENEYNEWTASPVASTK